MVIYRDVFKRVRALALACALSAAVVVSAPCEARADETPAESPFSQIGTFADEIKDFVGSLADAANERAAERERAGRREAVIGTAMDLRGVPYVYGGTTPSGFDCSGFTRWVYEQALGIELPRTAAEQSAMGESVPMDGLMPGDLLFWGSGSGVYHVAIYAGDGEYIHASTGRGQIVRQTMEYFVPDFAKRLIA